MDNDKSGAASALPEVTFSTFALSLASSILVHLGEVPDPATGQRTKRPELAKHGIDTLAMLQEKTEKGLTPDEKGLLDSVVYELKMKYVCLAERR